MTETAQVNALTAVVRADVSDLKKDLKKGINSFMDFDKSVKNAFGAVGSIYVLEKLGDGIRMVAGAVKDAAVMFAEFAKAGYESNRELQNLAETLGWSASELNSWKQAASAKGFDIADSLTELDIRLGQAMENGGGSIGEWFKRTGHDLQAFIRMNPEQRLLKIAEITKSLETRGQKSRFLSELFSDKGAEKGMAFFNQGPAKISAFIDKAKELGIALTDAERNGLSVADESTMQLSNTMTALSEVLAVSTAPHVYMFSAALQDQIKSTDDLKGSTQAFIDDLVMYIVTGVDLLQKFLGLLQATIVTFQLLALAVSAPLEMVGRLLDLITGTNHAQIIIDFNDNLIASMASTFEDASTNLSWKEENRAGLAFYKNMLSHEEDYQKAVAERNGQTVEGGNSFTTAGPTGGATKLASMEDEIAKLRLDESQQLIRSMIHAKATDDEIEKALTLLNTKNDLLALQEQENQAKKDAIDLEKKLAAAQEKKAEEQRAGYEKYRDMITSDADRLTQQLDDFLKFNKENQFFNESEQQEIGLKMIREGMEDDYSTESASGVTQAIEQGSSAANSMILRARSPANDKGPEIETARNTKAMRILMERQNRLNSDNTMLPYNGSVSTG